MHCSPSAFGLHLHRNRSLALLSAAGLPSAAPANPCLRQAGAWGESPGTCSPCSYGLPKATLGILHRLQTLPRSSRQLAGLPLLFLWASKSDVRHFAPPLNPPRAFKPFPAPLAYSCIAALPASGGSLGREPWNVQPVLLWASKSDVRHFAPPSNPPPRLQTLPSAFGLLLHRSLALFLFSAARRPASSLLFLWASKSDVRHFAPPLNPPRAFKPFPAPLAYSCIAALPCLCVRREPGERASGTCIAALPASGGSLGREPLERAARALQPQRLWPTPASQPCPLPLLGSLQACLFSSYGLPKATLGTLHRL